MNTVTRKLYYHFPALSRKNFRLYFSGQCVSAIGSWMQNVGQSWLVLTLTEDAFKLGIVNAMQFLPIMFFVLFGGALADRLPKKKVLMITQVLLAILALTLATITALGIATYWMVLLLAMGLGTVSAIDQPCRQSIVMDLVGKDILMNAVTINSMAFNLARVLGPAVAALLIDAVGIGWCFFFNSFSYAVFFVLLLKVKMPQDTVKKAAIHVKDILQDIQKGLKYVAKMPSIYVPIMTLLGISMLAMNYNIILPLFSQDILLRGATGYGMMTTAMGLGSICASITLSFLSTKKPKSILIYSGAFGVSVFLIFLSFARSYAIAIGSMFFIGYFLITLTVNVNSSIQMASKSEMRGRVISVYSLVMGGITPIGSLYAGAVSKAWGVATCLRLSGILCILITLMMLIIGKKIIRKEDGLS